MKIYHLYLFICGVLSILSAEKLMAISPCGDPSKPYEHFITFEILGGPVDSGSVAVNNSHPVNIDSSFTSACFPLVTPIEETYASHVYKGHAYKMSSIVALPGPGFDMSNTLVFKDRILTMTFHPDLSHYKEYLSMENYTDFVLGHSVSDVSQVPNIHITVRVDLTKNPAILEVFDDHQIFYRQFSASSITNSAASSAQNQELRMLEQIYSRYHSSGTLSEIRQVAEEYHLPLPPGY